MDCSLWATTSPASFLSDPAPQISVRTGLIAELLMSAFRHLMTDAISPIIRHDVGRRKFQALPLRSFGSDDRINTEEAKLPLCQILNFLKAVMAILIGSETNSVRWQ
jgi:hypothetical protein